MRHIYHIPLGLSIPINHTRVNCRQPVQLKIIKFSPLSNITSIDFISNMIGEERCLTDVGCIVTVLIEFRVKVVDFIVYGRGRP